MSDSRLPPKPDHLPWYTYPMALMAALVTTVRTHSQTLVPQYVMVIPFAFLFSFVLILLSSGISDVGEKEASAHVSRVVCVCVYDLVVVEVCDFELNG